MKILLVSSEVEPFAKTGGLADVCGALPVELAKSGHEVIVCLPAYRSATTGKQPIESTETELTIPMGDWQATGRLLVSKLPNSEVRVWLVQHDGFFGRDGIYQDSRGDFGDNCQRYSFFCRFVLELLKAPEWFPDVIHCNDWQTGLIPAHLATRLANEPGYRQIATLMTVHNLAYQGHFSAELFSCTGIDPKYFSWRHMEFFGSINLLKTGIVFADAISTVSPKYAREIQTAEQGCGLEDVLQQRSDCLFGLLNGIDTHVWSPNTDSFLVARYDVDDWREGKAANKRVLQQETGLPQQNVPMIGLIGRLVSQKGWPLILPVMQRWLERHVIQWAVLGTGDSATESALRRLRYRYPGRLAVGLGYSEELAHRIEASADMFLMPSRYEPCGLNQMYSMRYGTIPVVRRTGGLADTVFDVTTDHLERGVANGFAFDNFDEGGLQWALARAVNTFQHRSDIWQELVQNGMTHDWSWTKSARRYEELYRWMIVSRAAK